MKEGALRKGSLPCRMVEDRHGSPHAGPLVFPLEFSARYEPVDQGNRGCQRRERVDHPVRFVEAELYLAGQCDN